MPWENLILLGIVFIVLGIILIFVGAAFHAGSAEETIGTKNTANSSWVIGGFIGPIPIIYSSNKRINAYMLYITAASLILFLLYLIKKGRI